MLATLLELPIDPLAFTDPIQLAALAILVVGYLLYRWINTLRAETAAVAEDVKATRDTLTTNNSGSHVKDSLDRIETSLGALTATVAGIDARLTEVEDEITDPAPEDL